jgi:DNA replication protein DnaC
VDGGNGHGDVARLFPGATGARCDGTDGWATVVHPEAGPAWARCPLSAADKAAAAVDKVTPPRFRLPVAVPPAVEAWASCGRAAQGLYLAGPVGTGKTHAAWMAVRMWCAATGVIARAVPQEAHGGTVPGPGVIFTRMTDLLDDLRPGDGARARVRDCQQADLLVIDDLGAEKASEWTQERLYSVIDHRYAACLPLVVTSNLPPAEVAAQAGERTASRLAEMCAVVPMTGTDRRRPA